MPLAMQRRPSDMPCMEASRELAAEVLGWRTRRNMPGMCCDGWA